MVCSIPSSMSRAASFHPMKSNIMAPESITELGLMTSLSAYFGARRHAQPAHLSGGRVGNVIAIQIGRGQHLIFVRAGENLLKDGVGDAVVHHDLLLPLAFAVSGGNRIDHVFHFGVDFLAQLFRALL